MHILEKKRARALMRWGMGLGSLVVERETQGLQGATLYPGIFDWMTLHASRLLYPGALSSWMLMKPTVCYGACHYLSFPYLASQAEMNQPPVSLRPFFQVFQVLPLRLSNGL